MFQKAKAFFCLEKLMGKQFKVIGECIKMDKRFIMD